MRFINAQMFALSSKTSTGRQGVVYEDAIEVGSDDDGMAAVMSACSGGGLAPELNVVQPHLVRR